MVWCSDRLRMKFLVDWISLQVGELLGYGACYLFIAWSTVIHNKAISRKAIYSKWSNLVKLYIVNGTIYIYIPLGKALKVYFIFSVFSLVHTHLYKSFSQSSHCILSLLFLCVHLDRVCALLCDPNNTRFTSQFWKTLQKAWGTQLRISTSFHPQTDGQTEWLNQILEDMLRDCVMNFAGCWDEHLPLIEFAYNNSYQATI